MKVFINKEGVRLASITFESSGEIVAARALQGIVGISEGSDIAQERLKYFFWFGDKTSQKLIAGKYELVKGE